MRKHKIDKTTTTTKPTDPGNGFRLDSVLNSLAIRNKADLEPKPKNKIKMSDLLPNGSQGFLDDVELFSVWRHRSTGTLHLVHAIEKTIFKFDVFLIECDPATIENFDPASPLIGFGAYRTKTIRAEQLVNLYFFVR